MDFSSHKSLFITVLSLFLGLFLAACAPLPASGAVSPTKTIVPTDTIVSTDMVISASASSPTPLSIISPTPPQPICLETTGSLTTATLPSRLSKYPTELKIYTPPCYSERGDKKFPVLYMLHGQTYTDSQWIDLGLLNKADSLIDSGVILPMIIVLPNEEDSMSFADTSSFGDIVVREVIPYIDQNYAACAEKSCRAIGGLSRGGNWAVRIGLSHPDLFTAIGAHSAPLFYNDLERVSGWIKAIPAGQDPPMIYIDFGKSDEDRSSMIQFDQVLTKLDVVHQMLQFNGFHDADYWSAHAADYLEWYSASFN